MKFTQVPLDTYQSIQINAGVLLNEFDPATEELDKSAIVGATSGGTAFASNPTYADFGEDIDNVPPNTKQLKRVTAYNPALSGSFITVDNELGKKLNAAADVDESDSNHIIPRNYLVDEDFGDLWLVGDYSDKNGTNNGGFVAIRIKNALNLGGFQWQTTKDGKGTFAFDFRGHYDLENIDDVPFELYIKTGTDETAA
jgi:hypothetical protein